MSKRRKTLKVEAEPTQADSEKWESQSEAEGTVVHAIAPPLTPEFPKGRGELASAAVVETDVPAATLRRLGSKARAGSWGSSADAEGDWWTGGPLGDKWYGSESKKVPTDEATTRAPSSNGDPMELVH